MNQKIKRRKKKSLLIKYYNELILKNLNDNSMVKKQIKESIDLKNKILNDKDFIELIEHVSEICTNVYRNNNKTILAEMGSAADSQHIAGEFVSRFYFDRPGLASISLTTDTSILTAIGNDYGYDRLFFVRLRQMEKKDLFLVSTSGNSKNILEALKSQRKRNYYCWSHR